MLFEFQSTYRASGMTVVVAKLLTDDLISINVPLARYDVTQLQAACIASISTHMPLARYDIFSSIISFCNVFQPTYLLCGMTLLCKALEMSEEISTHIPLAQYDIDDDFYVQYLGISIHIPLAQYDGCAPRSRSRGGHFNPHTARAV